MFAVSRTTLLANTAFTVFLSLGTVPASAEGTPWQATKVSGQAWVTTAGTKRDLVSGATLDSDVTVVTAERSRVLLVRGTETIMVGPVSVLAMAEHPDQQLSTTVLQKGGTVAFDVEKRNVQHFSVETPWLAAVVKGTHFTVAVGRASGTVAVDRGNVQVTALSTGQTSSIGVGQRANVDRGGLSVSGPGHHAAVTQTAPRESIVAGLNEVTPTTTVSVGEFAAARGLSEAEGGKPAKAGLFSAIASAFSHTGQQGVSGGGLFGTAASDESAHTSAAARAPNVSASPVSGVASVGSMTGRSPAAMSTASASTPGAAAESTAASAAYGSSAKSGVAGSPAAASVSSAAGPGPSSPTANTDTSAGHGTAGSPSATPSSPSIAGTAATSAGASTASAASSPSSKGASASPATSGVSSGKSDNGNGNAGTPGNGGANSASSGSGSSGKSDNGKGNSGTPGNGGANSGSSATGSSGKSDNGKGNGGTPGNGGANHSSSTGSSSGKGNGKS